MPVPTDPTGYVMSGMIADEYKGGDLSKILLELNHPAVTTRELEEEHREEVDASYIAKQDEFLVEEDGKKYLVTKTKKHIVGLKTYNDAILLGLNVYRNRYTPVYMKRKDRTRHHYII